jgi:hypothetical protein
MSIPMSKRRQAKRAQTPVVSITLDEDDFDLVKQDRSLAVSGALDVLNRDLQKPQKLSGDDMENIKTLIPGVISRKISQMVPQGFELTQLTFTGEVSGKPFGVGVSGTVSVVFKKNSLVNGD